MAAVDLRAIAQEINSRARDRPIRALQEIRRELKGLTRQPGHDIFSSATIHDEWAFHLGGRSELQFNIGLEDVDGVNGLRHGVAFSFETSQTLPTIDVLIPKVKFFNEFLQLYSDRYADMRMWHYRGERSPDSMPSPIPPELVTEGVFVFLGKRQQLDQLDYDLLLNDLDRLLPLYTYVESGGALQPISTPTPGRFDFRPGCTPKSSSTVASQAQKQLDMHLRHNELQAALYRRLIAEHGPENVGTELQSGVGTSVDLVVRRGHGYWFYEIKTAHSPRACLREAIGQLLEYAFWPGAQEAARLIVVGETAMDDDGREYLRRLRQRFSFPLEYEQISV
jgi:hypothetical protein